MTTVLDKDVRHAQHYVFPHVEVLIEPNRSQAVENRESEILDFSQPEMASEA